MNGVARKEPDKMFQLLIADLANQTRQILNGQVPSSSLISSTCTAKSTLTAQEVLGVVDERPATGKENKGPLKFHLLLTPDAKHSLNTLKLDRLPAKRQQADWQMMFKQCFMWTRKL